MLHIRNIFSKIRDFLSGRLPKPNLPAWLFWEFHYDRIKWKKSTRMVIERVLERGNEEELEELIRFYGLRKVRNVLQFGTIYLTDPSIERACAYFKLKPEELVCYVRKRSRPGHWH
jgi:hypothetical protein